MSDQEDTGVGRELSNTDKAAVLLISLGESDAAEILKHLGPKQVQRIGQAMAALDNIPQSKVESVIGDFLSMVGDQTGIGINNDVYIRAMLNEALGEEKAKTLLDRILISKNTSGLDTLRWMEPRQIAEIIHYEHPQIQAVIISYLDPDVAAAVLAFFDEKVRLDIVMRVASLDSIQPVALQELNDILERQFSGGTGTNHMSNLGGLQAAASIMNFIDSNIEAEVMDGIKEADELLANKIADMMFVFDNLIDVDDRAIQAILREVATDVLILALKGADTSLQEKVFRNMSKRAAELLRDDLEAKGPVRVSEVEEAQREVLATARRLADEGEIVLGGGGDEMI
ncbi:MAG: flagellar motor switch protein FliG [Pontibacterium sp.]